MDRALRFYPFDHLDLIRAMPDHHWFIRGFHLLRRMPTREELQMPWPPFGLLHDEDYEEEMQLQMFLDRRMARRAAHERMRAFTLLSKHHLSLFGPSLRVEHAS
jgi:hypothetical protein